MKITLLSVFIFCAHLALTGEASAQTQSWTTGAYPNNAYLTKTLTVAGATSVTYSVSGITEANYDFITVKDGRGNIVVNRASGNVQHYGSTDGNSLSIVFTSDSTIIKSGVTVTMTPNFPSTGAGSTSPGTVTPNNPPTLNLTNLPAVMRQLNFPTGANWMDRWFYGDGTNLVVNLNDITALSAAAKQAKEHWNYTTTLFQNKTQQDYLIANLRRTNNSAGKNVLLFGGSYDHISLEFSSTGNTWKSLTEEDKETYYVSERAFTTRDVYSAVVGTDGVAAVGE